MTANARACVVCDSLQCARFMQVEQRHYWRCEQCQATFLDPSQLPGKAEEAHLYRQHRNEIHDPDYRRFLSRLATPLLERLTPGLQGLDYGCGPGPALAAMFTEAGHSMSVYDPLFFHHPSVLLRAYDFITCTEVAEHFHRPREEFAKLDCMLKPRSWLAVMTKFQNNDASFANWHYRRDPTHVVFYRAPTFKVIAGRHGWQCEIPCADVVLFRKGAQD